MDGLDYLFNPRSVAIIGASREPRKFGHVILSNFVKRFRGKVYPINPNAEELMNLKCYPSVLDVPDEIDLTVIVIPAEYVESALLECGKKGIKAVVIIPGGFSEVGEKEREKRLTEIARKYGMRLVGPNCIGIFDTYSHVDTMFSPMYKQDRPFKGRISFISQSGAYGTAIMDKAAMENMGISKFVSIGNRADVDEIEMIKYLGNDKNTGVIVLYLEGTKNGRGLFNALREVGVKKPIVAMKGGKTSEGSRATLSHTASLAGSSEIFKGMFRQSGVLLAENSEELFDFARALAYLNLPKGDRIQIVTNAGGFGVISADEIIENKLSMAKLSEGTIDRIKKILPSYAIVGNPIDLVGDADSRRYERVLKYVMKDKGVDAVFVVMLLQLSALESDVVDVLISVSSEFEDKPLMVCTTGGEFTQVHTRMMEKVNIPTYPTPERGIRAMKALVDYSRYRGIIPDTGE